MNTYEIIQLIKHLESQDFSILDAKTQVKYYNQLKIVSDELRAIEFEKDRSIILERLESVTGFLFFKTYIKTRIPKSPITKSKKKIDPAKLEDHLKKLKELEKEILDSYQSDLSLIDEIKNSDTEKIQEVLMGLNLDRIKKIDIISGTSAKLKSLHGKKGFPKKLSDFEKKLSAWLDEIRIKSYAGRNLDSIHLD
ncbi:MAG: hypothetical protein H7A24_00155 [Leptospiraceae bacterium]|nr:hypothetical protein [Leptospiraceae bacterium]MCP5510263.1 hypothetical protein [Leptospiraceae bacterium]